MPNPACIPAIVTYAAHPCQPSGIGENIDMRSELRIVPVTPDLVPALAQLAADTFTETFGYLFSADDLGTFLAQSYAPDVLARATQATDAFWRLAVSEGGTAVGYLHVTPVHLPHADANAATDGELRRLYIRRSHHGQGLGQRLMDLAVAHLDRAFPNGAHWISVWNRNETAIALYQSYGFEKAGEYLFNVGSAPNLMFILRRPYASLRAMTSR